MKRNWQPEELIEHWTLIPTELNLLTKKAATNRLGIALLLKYFQYEGRFPTSKAEIPSEVVRYVAQCDSFILNLFNVGGQMASGNGIKSTR